MVKAMTPRMLAEAPESARACTAQGRFMRQKWNQFSSFGVVSTMQMLEMTAAEKPISKTVSPPPSAFMAASLHE